ncbi:MAG TPA: hypothetical protein VFH08_10690 [Chitinophagaceae bacterium]|nr:hypothetical protein [Chitinophagaceae bacterium]
MDLNTIKFDATDIALLFRNSLVEINSENPVLPQTDVIGDPIPIGWKYLGENKKKSLIVVRYPGEAHLPDKQLSFLTRLLAACNLTIADVAVVNFQQYKSSDFDKIIDHFKPKVVLLFDISPGEFGMPMLFPQFQVQRYKDAVFVSSPSLEVIEPDKALKGNLWVCLKKVYNL